jgi:hypothetical protein
MHDGAALKTHAKAWRWRALVAGHRAVIYFAVTFAVSWIGAFAVVAPMLLRGRTVPQMGGLMMFPAMLLGPPLAGVALTAITGGRRGLEELFARMRRVRAGRWYAGLLMPPCVILIVLSCLRAFVSPVYAPNRFLLGISFGVVAGYLKEVGWTGFPFPAMCSPRRTEFAVAVLLGLFWGLWHLPVIDYLGTATPHGPYLFPYFLAFIAVMMAMRVLIAWLYINTNSVLLAQLMHASSTFACCVQPGAGSSMSRSNMVRRLRCGSMGGRRTGFN